MNQNLRNVPRKIQVFENIEEIIRKEIAITKHEEPFYIVNIAAILNQHKNWLMKLPRVKPFYAVKCNPQSIMIEVLAALGANFDCASKGEIESVLALNVTPDRIVYANPCKTRTYIKHAKSRGVDLMTFDGEFELKKIANLFPESRLILRIKVDDSHSLFQFSSKFGASVEQAYNLLDYAKKLNLNIVGVSFHVGSGCGSAQSFESAIQDAKTVFEYGKNVCGFNMNILDIGGGFPGTANPEVSFDEMANVINKTLEKEFPVNYIDNLEIIAEPGRYYAASVFTLATQIIAKKVFPYTEEDMKANKEMIEKEGLLKYKPNLANDQSNEQKLKDVDQTKGVAYYLNESLYGSFSSVFFEGVKVEPQPYYLTNDENVIKMSKLNYLNSTLWGPTCDSLDCIRKNIYLPEMHIGDWVVFREMGAYTISTSCGFNGFELPTIKYYLDNYTLNALKTLACWPRVKNCITRVEKKEEEKVVKEPNMLPSLNLKQLNTISPKIKMNPKKAVQDIVLIPVH